MYMQVHGKKLRIKVSAFYAMVDGKAANAIVGNLNTHVCPLCVPGADSRVGPAFFHSRLNVVEWLIRVAAQKQVAQAIPSSNDQDRQIKKVAGRQKKNLKGKKNLLLERRKASLLDLLHRRVLQLQKKPER